MAKAALIIIGVLFLIATFFVTQVAISQADKGNAETVDSLCNAKLFGLNVGQALQKPLGQEQNCQSAHFIVLLNDYGWIGYAFGALFLILGLVLGNGEGYEQRRREIHSRYCGSCGEGLKGHERHCPGCGKKV